MIAPGPIRSWALAMLMLLALTQALGQDVQPVPVLDGRVIDRTGTLSEPQRAALEERLAAIEAKSGSQIVVLMVGSTQPEDIAAYAQRVADAWKIGRKKVGDGVLIVVAKDERRVRIEVAKALEGAIPDLAAHQIIDAQMKPAFRGGDFAGGLAAAIDRLDARIAGEGLPAPEPRAERERGVQLEELAMFFFVAVPVIGAVLTRVLGRKLGSLATAGAAGGIGWLFSASVLLAAAAALIAIVLVGIFGFGSALGRGRRAIGRHGFPAPVVFGGGGFGGGGSGGGFGGGFSSGGGGDFGGGGASGSW